ncbi:AraC family transcriptional regulator [Luteibacter sp. CQ10]|uniref:AraC family transcriptional regulator n=1 Tax=Luteibacter sp. CQ10 TaxID=2805821 RepID=UPI0034A15E4C
MTDPLAEVVSLLQPGAGYFKMVAAAGRWRLRRTEYGQPFYGVVLEGRLHLAVDGHPPVVLEEGDFVLIPAALDFTMTSFEPPLDDSHSVPEALGNSEFRLGSPDDAVDMRSLVGHCVFASPDASLLVSLLPQFLHVRNQRRLTTLVQLVGEESRARLPARDIVIARLLEVLFIEALRSLPATDALPGLVRGLADERLAAALRRMHEDPARGWTVPQLASEAALSRSAFFERFQRAVGVAPMEYLLTWRMALAKDLLKRTNASVSDIALRVGYSSASTFSVAFTRHTGVPPSRYVAPVTDGAGVDERPAETA